MRTVELVVDSSSSRGSYASLDSQYDRTRFRQLAAVAGVVVLGVCALLVLVGNASLQGDDSVYHAMSLAERKAALRAAVSKSTMLDEAFEKENANAYVAALQPFLKSKDASEVKWVQAFDPKALSGEVKSYSDDIAGILKGVDEESKLLAKFTKPDQK